SSMPEQESVLLHSCVLHIHRRQAALHEWSEGSAVVYEGARLITGDGGASIENAVFVVENGRFSQVGHRGGSPGIFGWFFQGRPVMPRKSTFMDIATAKRECHLYLEENPSAARFP